MPFRDQWYDLCTMGTLFTIAAGTRVTVTTKSLGLHEGDRSLSLDIERELRATAVDDYRRDGDVMRRLGCKPGPIIGRVLEALLQRVLDAPELNESETLLALVDELGKQEPAQT